MRLQDNGWVERGADAGGQADLGSCRVPTGSQAFSFVGPLRWVGVLWELSNLARWCYGVHEVLCRWRLEGIRDVHCPDAGLCLVIGSNN